MTRLMVLGLLAVYGPMSGYEIQQMMQSSKTDTWAGVFPASIYHALKKMEQEKLVELETVQQTGNRFKSIYKITDPGREEFRKILQGSFKTSSLCLPTVLYTALTFCDELETQDILSSLDIQEEQLKRTYAEMRAGQEAKASIMDIPPNVSLIFDNIYAQCELQLRFIQDLKELLTKRC